MSFNNISAFEDYEKAVQDEGTLPISELGKAIESVEDVESSTVELYQTKEGNFRFKLKIRPFSEYDHSKPPPKKKLLHGWLPHRRTAAINAPGGKLKSTLLVYESIKTAKLGKLAVIVSSEDEADDYYSKFWTALNTPESPYYGEDIEKLSKYIVVVDISGTGYKLAAGPDNLAQRAPWVDNMIESIKELGTKVGFVAFETASRLCYGEDNTDFSGAITIIDHVAMKLDCACAISHHTAKFVAREKLVDNHTGRGGSALGDNTRSSIAMTALDSQYGGIRMPLVPQSEINEGRIVEMAHTRNSFGPLMEPRYYRAVSGAGHAPYMEEIPSLRRDSKEAIEWKVKHGADQTESIAEAILSHMRDELAAGRDHVGSDLTDNENVRGKALPGVSRNPARAALKKLVEEEKVIKVQKGTGRPVQYYLVGEEPSGASESHSRPEPTVDDHDYWFDPEAKKNAADY